MEFKGFDGWVPIFRGGKQKDSQGREHDGDALIDTAVAKFNAGHHEPPACIGHPADNAPAYGWVEGLKKQAGLLLAKFKQVQPEFAGMVKQGLFKKRSAAFYPDGSLRHVAFLGAAPPAVKGLPDMAFSEAADAAFDFADYQTAWSWEAIARLFGRLRDYLIEKEGVEKADAVIANYQIEEIAAAAAKEKQELQQPAETAQPMYQEEKEMNNFKEFLQKLKELVQGAEAGSGTATPAGKTFSEADLAAQVKQAADQAAAAERAKLTAEFAEKDLQARKTARREEIGTWCATMVEKGKLTPALVKFGVPEMLMAFAEREDVIEFGEEKAKATLYDRFKALVETELPKLITFEEIARRDKDTGAGAAGKKREALIATFMEQNVGTSYKDAVLAVSKDNQDLFREEE